MNEQRRATVLFLGVSLFAICISLAGTQVHPPSTCEYMRSNISVQLFVYMLQQLSDCPYQSIVFNYQAINKCINLSLSIYNIST
jgi:hypothetical protein